MAETAAKTPANPRSRSRAKSSTPAAQKTTQARATAPKAAPEPEVEEPTRIAITLGAPIDETKTYTKFALNVDENGNDTGMVGTLYAPLGTQEVRVALIGPADVVNPE